LQNIPLSLSESVKSGNNLEEMKKNRGNVRGKKGRKRQGNTKQKSNAAIKATNTLWLRFWRKKTF
jgi:hypothetical protein